MSELTRAALAPARAELRRDTRREFRLLAKAAVGFAILAILIVIRVVFFE